MHKNSLELNKIKIFKELLKSWKNIPISLSQHKNNFKIAAFIMTITALFLGIDSTDIFLKRIQALLLLVLTIFISYILLSTLLTFFKGKNSEMYYAFGLVFQFIGALFIYNLFGFLFSSFSDELIFYLKYIGIPLIAVATNIISILFFKLIRKYKNIKGNQLEIFFLFTLNLNITTAYIWSDFNFLKTIQKLISLEFLNLFLIYFFLLTTWSEIRPFKKKGKKSIILELFITLLLILAPFLIRYILPLILF